MIENFIGQVRMGRQVGIAYSFSTEGVVFWEEAAVQSYCRGYVTHLTKINEKNIDCEKFDFYETHFFERIEDALDNLKSKMTDPSRMVDFKAFKGQKAFNPSAEDILGLPSEP